MKKLYVLNFGGGNKIDLIMYGFGHHEFLFALILIKLSIGVSALEFISLLAHSVHPYSYSSGPSLLSVPACFPP